MKSLERAWYTGAKWPLLLMPLEILYRVLAARDQVRKKTLQQPLPVPVLVIGNINVGGTGKSPVVALLCRELKRLGWHPGIISRGYGGQAGQKGDSPVAVTAESDPALVGDEPVMLAMQTQCPVVVDQNRFRAAEALLTPAFFQGAFAGKTPCNLVISDDGLQHLSLPRDIEWVVVDAKRGLGNGHCLPVGPLRESADRLQQVDLVLANGADRALAVAEAKAQPMALTPRYWRNLKTGQTFTAQQPPFDTHKEKAIAVAGIGHPERFFQTLDGMGFRFERRPLDDHHLFTAHDLPDDQLILMTAKDGVKCQRWASEKHWVLDVEAEINPDIVLKLHHQLLDILKRKDHG